MHPSPAEITRTLATGRLLGTVQTAHPSTPGPLRVRHATTLDGTPLLLTRDGSAAGRALACAPGEDVAAVLRVEDVPPLPESPSLGSVWVSGWTTTLDGEEARGAAMQFAAVNPVSDLLAVGDGYSLHRLDVAEVRLERGSGFIGVDEDAYAAAEPDPIAPDEAELLTDLDDHHGDAVAAFVCAQLESSGHGNLLDGLGGEPPRIVRLDRYGMAVTAGPDRYARLGFSGGPPVTGRLDLIRRMRPLLSLRCTCHDPADH